MEKEGRIEIGKIAMGHLVYFFPVCLAIISMAMGMIYPDRLLPLPKDPWTWFSVGVMLAFIASWFGTALLQRAMLTEHDTVVSEMRGEYEKKIAAINLQDPQTRAHFLKILCKWATVKLDSWQFYVRSVAKNPKTSKHLLTFGAELETLLEMLYQIRQLDEADNIYFVLRARLLSDLNEALGAAGQKGADENAAALWQDKVAQVIETLKSQSR